MTDDQRREIERLLQQLMSEREIEHFWETPQAFLDGGYPAAYPQRTLETLQSIVDRNFR